LSRALELDPHNGEYYYSRGLAHQANGDREAARRDFQRAVALGDVLAKLELSKMGF
jgi:Flp pilus assembly protein TadD